MPIYIESDPRPTYVEYDVHVGADWGPFSTAKYRLYFVLSPQLSFTCDYLPTYLPCFPACCNLKNELQPCAFLRFFGYFLKQRSPLRARSLRATIVECCPAIFFRYEHLYLGKEKASVWTGRVVMGAWFKHTLLGEDCTQTMCPPIFLGHCVSCSSETSNGWLWQSYGHAAIVKNSIAMELSWKYVDSLTCPPHYSTSIAEVSLWLALAARDGRSSIL